MFFAFTKQSFNIDLWIV